MGTNIYLVKKIRKEDINKAREVFNTALQDLQNTRDIYKVTEPVTDFLEKLKEEVHICKRSSGWQLLFQSHKELYECTWKSMTDYIKKVLDEGTYIMVDEYGDSYTLNDLETDLKDFSKGFTGKTYDDYCKAKGRLFSRCQNHEYISDNLRWTDNWFC